jgi:hypothetical protein
LQWRSLLKQKAEKGTAPVSDPELNGPKAARTICTGRMRSNYFHNPKTGARLIFVRLEDGTILCVNCETSAAALSMTVMEMLEKAKTEPSERSRIQAMGALMMGFGIKDFQGKAVDEAHL